MSSNSNKPYELSVVIGRFQLKHVGHGLLLNKAASLANNVLVLIGSSFKPRTYKNPFTYRERFESIYNHFNSQINPTAPTNVRVFVAPLIDNIYNNPAWAKQVQTEISKVAAELNMKELGWVDNKTSKESGICIVGHNKDESTDYLTWFPQYASESVEEFKLQIDATNIRAILFSKPENLPLLGAIIPKDVRDFLTEFRKTDAYKRLARDFSYDAGYKQKWGPGPFLTTDALVIKNGHILLVSRGDEDEPGYDLWALPGGFHEAGETIYECCKRELDEETSIDLPPGLLKGCLTKVKSFDDPKRSLRAHIITNAHVFELDGRDMKPGMPYVKAKSDAKEVKWFPIEEVLGMSGVMFEDHLDIIKVMLGLE
jgi:bifunctional NMN adenylyltransferase/nudix hydrolase